MYILYDSLGGDAPRGLRHPCRRADAIRCGPDEYLYIYIYIYIYMYIYACIRKVLKRNENVIRKRNVACKCENGTKRNVSERNRKETPVFHYFQETNRNKTFSMRKRVETKRTRNETDSKRNAEFQYFRNETKRNAEAGNGWKQMEMDENKRQTDGNAENGWERTPQARRNTPGSRENTPATASHSQPAASQQPAGSHSLHQNVCF